MNPMIAALQRPEAYGHSAANISLIETHISWIILTGTYAYKVKKPVNLGFVDFSTLERRRWFCQEEIRLNRRLAPDLYLDVCPIHGPPQAACLHGGSAVIDYAVRMRQFDQADLLPAVLERDDLRPGQLEALAVRLARFHATAAVVGPEDPFGAPAQVLAPVRDNFRALTATVQARTSLALLQSWSEGEFQRLESWLASRRLSGHLRECHGDLHLGNMVLQAGVIEVFDCLEFSPSLRWIDVISDLAFLVMDLGQRGRADLGVRLLDRWLAWSGDYPGLQAWRWYSVYRAMVRAKVCALQRGQAEAHPDRQADLSRQLNGYLQRALALSRHGGPAPCPRLGTPLLITHGVSGSGKSHLALALCRRYGWIQLRSDTERKRLFGRWGASLDPPRSGDPYDPEVSAWLYDEHLPSCAEAVIRAGFGVIVDATFLRQGQRQRFEQLAERLAVPFAILDCRIDLPLARRRVVDRQRQGSDPSDADLAVLALQIAARQPLAPAELPRSVAVSADWDWTLLGEPPADLIDRLEVVFQQKRPAG